MAAPGEAPSYVGTVRGSPADGLPGVHMLQVVLPRGSASQLLLKMLSLVEKSRWHLHRLAFVTEAPPLADDAERTVLGSGSAEQVRRDTTSSGTCLGWHYVNFTGPSMILPSCAIRRD